LLELGASAAEAAAQKHGPLAHGFVVRQGRASRRADEEQEEEMRFDDASSVALANGKKKSERASRRVDEEDGEHFPDASFVAPAPRYPQVEARLGTWNNMGLFRKCHLLLGIFVVLPWVILCRVWNLIPGLRQFLSVLS
jgi:hypothetical protein